MPSWSVQERLHLRKFVFLTRIYAVDMSVMFGIVQKFGDLVSVKQNEERSRHVYTCATQEVKYEI